MDLNKMIMLTIRNDPFRTSFLEASFLERKVYSFSEIILVVTSMPHARL